MRFPMIILCLPAWLMLQSCGVVENAKRLVQEDAADKVVEPAEVAHQDGRIDCTWQSLLPAYLHFNQELDYAAHVPGYIAAAHPDVWQQVKDDASAIHSASGGYVREMKQLRAGYAGSETFVIRVPVYYGEYDVKSETFPLKSKIKGGSDSSIADKLVSLRYSDEHDPLAGSPSPFPSRFELSFTVDPASDLPLRGIPLDQEERKEMIESRNRNRGYNRQAIAKIEFSIVGLKDGEEWPHFVGRITDIRYEI